MTDFCDLVLKGGITSGVVYPRLMALLATKYQFKNIGGTSAGAIAAGACAAAEYGRHHGNAQAFDQVAKLPDKLSARVTSDGRSKLFTLFQPAMAVRRHFSVLIEALNKQPRDAVLAVLGAVISMHKWLLALGLLSGSLLFWPFIVMQVPGLDHWRLFGLALGLMLLVACLSVVILSSLIRGHAVQAGLTTGMLLALIGLTLMAFSGHGMTLSMAGAALSTLVVAVLFLALLLGLVAVLFTRGLLVGLHGNHYGLCSGQTPVDATSNDQEGLTNWLTEYLNMLAGLPQDGAPLTFGHLWGHGDPNKPRDINLEVMTTAISQQMVYSIPFRAGTPRFYYDPEEWAKLFPEPVMAALSRGNDSDIDVETSRVQSLGGKALYPLPKSADLPVVVAVRMSLSFPVLLSAVPLYAVDWSLKASVESKQHKQVILAKRVWFSDGGIGSNMPLHMFDSLLPGHPTFAVNLKPVHPDYSINKPEIPDNEGGRIYLPENNSAGQQRYWSEPNDGSPGRGLIGLFMDIINTMQNWRDEIMFPYPGYRDRIVQISQEADEGGLNLDMPAASIQALGQAGEMAANRLVDRFHPVGGQCGEGWRQHQKARLTTFLGTMQPGSAAMQSSLSSGAWTEVLSTVKEYNGSEHQLASDFLKGVCQLGGLAAGKEISLDTRAPKPLAQVRISPRI